MSNYSKVTNFTAKDSLTTGDPNKIINGSLFDAEFDPIAVAVASKIDKVAGETGEIPVFTSSGGLESSGKTPANVSFVSGTVMSFFQAAAPTGWTQVTTHNDAMLRVVSTAGGGSGGTDSPILNTHIHTTAGHTLTIDEMPAHTHSGVLIQVSTNAPDGSGVEDRPNPGNTASTGGGASHTHGNTGSVSWAPKYLNMIIASKD